MSKQEFPRSKVYFNPLFNSNRVAIVNEDGTWLAECYSEEDAYFIVTACNYHDRLVESLSDLLADPDKYTVLEKTDLMIKAGNILKELEESCKEK